MMPQACVTDIQCTCYIVYTLQPYSLEVYRAREDKVSLLDAAIKYHDGNAIIIVSISLNW